MHRSLFAAAVCAGALFAGATWAESPCISQAASDALASCPGGKPKARVGKKRQVSVGGVKDVEHKEKVNELKPPAPAETTERDLRERRMHPQAHKFLLTEIANVERLYAATPKSDTKDRPQFLKRLAEDYVELESSFLREKILAEETARKTRTSDPQAASEAKDTARRNGEGVKVARRSAVRYYTTLKDEYSTWCQFPDAPVAERGCADEVLYYLAYEHELGGDLESARSAYLELTENWKTSHFAPNAYLAFGELYFQEAQGDPSKWPFAQNFYKKVLEYNSPDDKLWGFAAYKLGYVYWNQNDYAGAIAQFKSVIEFSAKYPEFPNAAGLAAAARRDIIPVYALKGDPAKAYDFFRPLAGDSKKTFAMLEDLGQNMLDTGHYPQAIVVYRDLLKRNAGDRSCFYQGQISDAVMADKSGDKPAIVAALGEQLASYQAFHKGGHSAESEKACANSTAAVIAETAMAWHLEAVGSGDVRGTADPKTMDFASKLYGLVLSNFDAKQFEDFKFPRIVKEDWPSIAKLRYLKADLLYFEKKWDECGSAFDEAYLADPDGPDAAEAAYAAVQCWQNVYARAHADGTHRAARAHGANLQPIEFGPEQKNMLAAFDRYLCRIEPPENDEQAVENYAEVAYARARTYYEAQHWEEAAAGFRDVATRFAKLDAGIYAAHLSLDALNVLGAMLPNPNPTCIAEIRRDVPKYLGSFCGDAKRDADACADLARIQRDVIVTDAVDRVRRADAGAPDKDKLYEEAANLYYDAWKKYGEADCRDKKPSCAKNDKILFNGAKAFQSARLIAKAIKLRGILLDPQFGLEKTEAAKLAVYLIGGNYQAVAVYQDAAEWYERFAAESPGHESAPDALGDAVVLRLGLGQTEKALDDASRFQTAFGVKHPAKAAKIAFAVGAHYAEREEWQNAERSLAAQIGKIDSQGSLDVRLQAHALLGRSYAGLGRDAQAKTHYALVAEGWSDPKAAVTALDALGGSDAEHARRVGKTLTAVGEALYFFAEKKRAEAAKIAFPAYHGSDDEKSLGDFFKSKVAEWYDKKAKAIGAANSEYVKIVALVPDPPPMWVIRAGAAVGAMWDGFITDFRKAPYPKAWDQPGFVTNTDPPLLWHELRAKFQDELEQAIERRGFKRAAKQAFEACLSQSAKFQYFDASSRACEKWLAKNYGHEYHLIDEFRGQSSRVNSPLDEKPQVLGYDGNPLPVDH